MFCSLLYEDQADDVGALVYVLQSLLSKLCKGELFFLQNQEIVKWLHEHFGEGVKLYDV